MQKSNISENVEENSDDSCSESSDEDIVQDKSSCEVETLEEMVQTETNPDASEENRNNTIPWDTSQGEKGICC